MSGMMARQDLRRTQGRPNVADLDLSNRSSPRRTLPRIKYQKAQIHDISIFNSLDGKMPSISPDFAFILFNNCNELAITRWHKKPMHLFPSNCDSAQNWLDRLHPGQVQTYDIAPTWILRRRLPPSFEWCAR